MLLVPWGKTGWDALEQIEPFNFKRAQENLVFQDMTPLSVYPCVLHLSSPSVIYSTFCPCLAFGLVCSLYWLICSLDATYCVLKFISIISDTFFFFHPSPLFLSIKHLTICLNRCAVRFISIQVFFFFCLMGVKRVEKSQHDAEIYHLLTRNVVYACY